MSATLPAQDELTIGAAQPEQVALITAILDEATQWVRAQGGQLWPLPFPRERLLQRFASGTIYLAWRDGAAIGTFALLPADALFWGERPADALYLHGLAIRPALAGRGVGQALVRWAEQQTRAVGRQYLRLDCQDANLRIRRYYEQLGFIDRGAAIVAERPYRLMEKDVRQPAANGEVHR